VETVETEAPVIPVEEEAEPEQLLQVVMLTQPLPAAEEQREEEMEQPVEHQPISHRWPVMFAAGEEPVLLAEAHQAPALADN
jgi:hypothetical protein